MGGALQLSIETWETVLLTRSFTRLNSDLLRGGRMVMQTESERRDSNVTLKDLDFVSRTSLPQPCAHFFVTVPILPC